MDDQEAIIARRQRIWADLTFLERAIRRHVAIFGTIPEHWQHARELLWRDLHELTASACTDSAQWLLGTVRRLTVNGPEVEAKIEAMLEGHEVLVTKAHVVDAMRNLGKPKGQEVAVGSSTEEMPNLGYPDGLTRLTKKW